MGTISNMEKGNEMNNELMERIRLFNCKAEKAENCGARVTSGGER